MLILSVNCGFWSEMRQNFNSVGFFTQRYMLILFLGNLGVSQDFLVLSNPFWCPKISFCNYVPINRLSTIFGYFTIGYVWKRGLNLNLLSGSKWGFERGSEDLKIPLSVHEPGSSCAEKKYSKGRALFPFQSGTRILGERENKFIYKRTKLPMNCIMWTVSKRKQQRSHHPKSLTCRTMAMHQSGKYICQRR